MYDTIPIIFCVLTAVFTVFSQFLDVFKKKPLHSKMLCSALFLLTGISAMIITHSSYSILITVALFFGLLGDFWLDYKKSKYFMTGVLFFSIGHLIYLYTFIIHCQASLLPYGKQISLGFLVLCVAAVLEVIIDIYSNIGLELGTEFETGTPVTCTQIFCRHLTQILIFPFFPQLHTVIFPQSLISHDHYTHG